MYYFTKVIFLFIIMMKYIEELEPLSQFLIILLLGLIQNYILINLLVNYGDASKL